jgi:hypothetical protein
MFHSFAYNGVVPRAISLSVAPLTDSQYPHNPAFFFLQVVCVRVETNHTSAIVKLLGSQLALPNLKYLKRVRRVEGQGTGSRESYVDVLLGPRAEVDKMQPAAYDKVKLAVYLLMKRESCMMQPSFYEKVNITG